MKGGKRDYLVELLTSKILQDVVTFVGISATQPDQSYLLKFYSNRDKVRRER